jgi:hypothetical protein
VVLQAGDGPAALGGEEMGADRREGLDDAAVDAPVNDPVALVVAFRDVATTRSGVASSKTSPISRTQPVGALLIISTNSLLTTSGS